MCAATDTVHHCRSEAEGHWKTLAEVNVSVERALIELSSADEEDPAAYDEGIVTSRSCVGLSLIARLGSSREDIL